MSTFTAVFEIIEDKPEYILSYYYLADAQYNQGKYKAAIKNAHEYLFRLNEKTAGRSQDNTPLPDSLRYQADVYNIMGMCHAETKHYTKAMEAYRTALQHSGKEMAAKVHYNIGNVHLQFLFQLRFQLLHYNNTVLGGLDNPLLEIQVAYQFLLKSKSTLAPNQTMV